MISLKGDCMSVFIKGRKGVTTLVPGVAAIATIAFLTSAVGANEARTGDVLGSRWACPALCVSCPENPQMIIAIAWNVPEFPGNFDHEHMQCNMVSCERGACGETFAPGLVPTNRLVQLVVSGNPASIRAAMTQAPSHVVYNAERHAVQILGCGSEPILHASLSPVQSAAFLTE